MSVSEADVRHIAALARIGIPDDRVPALVRELNGILLHMEALQGVQFPPQQPIAGRTVGMPLRDDDSAPVALFRAREEFAPSMRDGFFLVPRLDTHGTPGATDADGEDDS